MSWHFLSLPSEERECFLDTCSACKSLKPIKGGVLTHNSNDEKAWVCAICFEKKSCRALLRQQVGERER
jgi:hypothetical protein